MIRHGSYTTLATRYGLGILDNPHKFRHHIVKVAVDPQTTLAMLWRNSSSITEQTH